MLAPRLALCALTAATACVYRPPAAPIDAALPLPDAASTPPDAASTPDDALPLGACPPGPRGCLLPPGRYLPVVTAPFQRVYAPAGDRYINDHTLVRDDAGVWHVYGIVGPGDVNLDLQRSFLHATARDLYGPWTDQPDVLALAPDEPSHTSAPFIVREGDTYWMYYFWNVPDGGRLAHSRDLFQWDRDPGVIPGGRDPMVLRLDDGRNLHYSVGITTEPDGIHDTTDLYTSRSLTDWSSAAHSSARTNPVVCPNACWGWYESPFVTEVGGYYYLFVTFTDSAAWSYERTDVFRSRDPLHFDEPAITELRAHAAELVMADGRMFMTSAGWPSRIGQERRGLSIAPLAWVRVGD